MTALVARSTDPVSRLIRGVGGRIGRFWAGITAVTAKELRGRMRGRRAFVVVTIYLLLLSGFAFAIYWYLRQQADLQGFVVNGGVGQGFPGKPVPMPEPGTTIGTSTTALSATVGHAIFSGLLILETLLIVVLAPAFTSGAISLEREKQTLDLLVTTPLSTLGIVLGKLLSALTWVFLLIVASIPLAAIVFTFGGVGPEDLIRGYALLFALAFGMGAIGLFISALVRRTQTATVATFIVVFVLTLGSMGVWEFWRVAATQATSAPAGFVSVSAPARPPEQLLWLNPFVADADLVCTTAPGGYQRESCDYIAAVTGTPFFGPPVTDPNCPAGARCALPLGQPGGAVDDTGPNVVIVGGADGGGGVAVAPPAACDANGACVVPVGPPAAVVDPVPQQTAAFGFPRDTFWPQSALAFVVIGAVLTLLSAQLVAPTRRFGFLRRLPRLRPRHRPALRGAGALNSADPATLELSTAEASEDDPSTPSTSAAPDAGSADVPDEVLA